VALVVAGSANMTVRILTDSAATIPGDLAERFGIVTLPLRISVGDRDYLDGVLDHEALLSFSEEVKTSGPTPGDFLTAIDRLDPGDSVLIVTVSYEMGSSTFTSARAAANLADRPVQVLDSASAAGGQGLVVLAAAAAAASGADLAAAHSAAVRAVEKVRLVATLPDLAHLSKSGHVPEAAAWAVRFVGLHPVIDLTHGKVRPLRPALSEAAALDRIADVWRATIPRDPARLHIASLHALAPDTAAGLLARVSGEIEPSTSFAGSFGTGMVVHSGPGVIGLAWWWETNGA
jgi:DegV family protein with EDD domain